MFDIYMLYVLKLWWLASICIYIYILRSFRNLDLEACLWEMEAYFDMSELVTVCGGRIETDGQVRFSNRVFKAHRPDNYVPQLKWFTPFVWRVLIMMKKFGVLLFYCGCAL